MHPTHLFSAVLALSLAAVVCLPAQAARPVQPPLTELTRSQTHVMRARAVRRVDDERFEFQRLADLSGESAQLTAIRVAASAQADVHPGDTYVLAHSQIVSNPQRREEKLIDPRGPRIIGVRGLGTLALFEDTAEVRFLFATARGGVDGEATDEDAVVEALLRQLARPDARTRALVAMELYLRDELHPRLDEAQTRRLVDVVADPALEDELRAYLVETAAAAPGARTYRWLFDTLRDILDASAVTLELAGHRPRLVTESLIALRQAARPDDAGRAARLLRSNAPRVVEAAIELLDGVDPALAQGTVNELVEETAFNDALPAHTRRVLEDYLVRSQLAPPR